LFLLSTLAMLVVVPSLHAQGHSPAALPATSAQQAAEQESVYDRIWRFAEWYDDPDNPVVQQVLFSGRFHYDFAAISADEGSHDEWNVRRLRLGPRIRLFRRFLFHAEVELNPQERDPSYVRLTDFYGQWSRSPELVVTVGKHGAPFTMDGATSSRELLTIDRSNLSNNIWFPQEYLPGVSVSGVREAWRYRAGVYSSGGANREFGDFEGGAFVLASVGRDVAEALGVEDALVTGYYVFQSEDPENTFTRQLGHIGSVTLALEHDNLGFRGDLSAATGQGSQGDLLGIMAMPYVNVTEQLQLVSRYTFLSGSGDNAVRLATYESRVTPSRGDLYHELYLGANYYFYGHRLKAQSGVQLANLSDRGPDDGGYAGVSWVMDLRIGW
jgi:phosphate-selective porin OprO/OprP